MFGEKFQGQVFGRKVCMHDCGGGNLIERDHLEDTDFEGKIIF